MRRHDCWCRDTGFGDLLASRDLEFNQSLLKHPNIRMDIHGDSSPTGQPDQNDFIEDTLPQGWETPVRFFSIAIDEDRLFVFSGTILISIVSAADEAVNIERTEIHFLKAPPFKHWWTTASSMSTQTYLQIYLWVVSECVGSDIEETYKQWSIRGFMFGRGGMGQGESQSIVKEEQWGWSNEGVVVMGWMVFEMLVLEGLRGKGVMSLEKMRMYCSVKFLATATIRLFKLHTLHSILSLTLLVLHS